MRMDAELNRSSIRETSPLGSPSRSPGGGGGPVVPGSPALSFSDRGGPTSAANQRVRLNVGGKMFETLLATLQKAGEESNIALVAREAANKDLPMFIDRDPDTFAIILNYLRTSQLLIPSWADSSTLQLLRSDAAFYGIQNQALLELLEKHQNHNKSNYSITLALSVPEVVTSEIKAAGENLKRRDLETKWLSWYKEDILGFAKVFKATSISSFTAQFATPALIRMAFVVWNTDCTEHNIHAHLKDLCKLHFIEHLDVTQF